MKETFTLSEPEDDNVYNDMRKSSQFGFKTNTKSKKEFVMTSITIEKTRINRLFGKITNYDDDIFIFEIKGIYASSSDITWKLYKKYKEIKELFEQMKKELSKNDITDEFIVVYCKMVKKYSEDEINDNINNIAKYIISIYNSENGKQLESLNEFLGISATSFSNTRGTKPMEGYALKKAEPRFMRSLLKYIVYPLEYWLFKGWNKRWIVLKDDMISYLNTPTTLTGKNVYWFDEDIEISSIDKKVLEIKNLSRILSLKFNSSFERDLWKKEIEQRVNVIKEGITNNAYASFTSQKSNCGARWFIDGKSYFEYLLNQLKGAKESVYITDWFMSPELALKRPINYDEFKDNENYINNLTFGNVSRLMDVFYLLAKKGVKIYILLYCEVSLALAINSAYAKSTLKRLHPNILITRHPKNDTTLLWSHHEKLVIIDQKIAFVGGLDLCWGRYDTNEHPIVEEENPEHMYYYPGADFVNERQVDLHDVDKFYKEQLDRNSMPRMGWHDIHTMVEGPIVSDIVRHFVERWNDANFNRRERGLVNAGVSFCAGDSREIKKDEKENKKKEKEKKKKEKEKKNKKVKVDKGFFLTKKKTMIEDKNFPKSSKILFPEKFNPGMDDIKEEESDDDEIKISNNVVNIDNIKDEDNNINKNDNKDSNKEKTNDNNKNYINDSNNDDNNKEIHADDDDDDDSLDDKPKFEIPLKSKESDDVFNQRREALKKNFTIFGKKKKAKDTDSEKEQANRYKVMKIKQKVFLGDEELKDPSIKMDCNIQALRSVTDWSIGKSVTEHSILSAYYKLIDNAKHYIYIENQFFITKPFSESERKDSNEKLDKLVLNEIGLHIRNRIERAYQEKSKFKVFICIPLLPGFSGTPGESSTMDGVLKHHFQSINHNKGYSLLELLRKQLGDDYNKYIYFFSLRNHGKIKEVPVTELIYIHSKLLIVDDEIVLMGSANINDRSMLGERDSEFAVIVEQQNKIDSIMDNKPYKAAEYAKSLRKHLMSEHIDLDINDYILDDPISEELWSTMKSRAKRNSNIYRNIFDCFPDNKFKTFDDLKKRKIFKTDEEIKNLKEKYEESIIGIKGHIVEYPIDFLENEELNIDFFSKENLLPEKNFI